ncbi:polysaccharide biosynthesis protein [Achromobacter sp. Marseille-Q0513]|uniref:polysaccharide biosynthesis protein n=1 Tax=Achromobacter sp. Marseille-Q0513 TaxID=2829161 RepID=UPI001B9785D9|nr:nucleoside-diphosphate sugar epimerase/dehydratase [Achromobacter sp. Marseille-Q0513]MBR8657280.1 polysaccharide biosynthesis protein [Achromobacter sp. Marseille-Q0513]
MNIPIRSRTILVFLFDLSAIVVAWLGAFLIRFNFEWPIGWGNTIWMALLMLLPVQILACRAVGMYRSMWLFASMPDLKRVLKVVAASTVALLVFAFLVRNEAALPRSILLLYPLLLVLLMGGARAAWRMWKEYRMYGRVTGRGAPVVVVGAGTAGAMLVRELSRSIEWRVVALVDDNPAKWGLELSGCRVVGGTDRLANVLDEYGVNKVILAIPSAGAPALRRVMEIATGAGASLYTVPGLDELMSGRVAINMMRPVKIEDLLGREAVQINNLNIQAMIADRHVLVTGAGGSIGSELCRQLARFSPSCLILLEASEYALYSIEQWFAEHQPNIRIVPLAGDVKDAIRMEEIFQRWEPEVVFHAAAYKHVPLMEVGNAWQAVRNNVLGTLNVAECAKRFHAKRFVLISTDKAVNPTNVMGATKRMAEMICEVLHCQGSETCFQMVRFGNVLGSAGSVIPKFQAQIARGGPVTVTHPDITRYFMSIPEAAQLVLQAASMGQGGEIFVLDMGEPVKIADLARNMIRLSGYTEDQIRIEYSGLRPGEKLYEELLADSEETRQTPHEKLRIARSRSVPEGFYEESLAWMTQRGPVSDDEVRAQLKRWMQEYVPARL